MRLRKVGGTAEEEIVSSYGHPVYVEGRGFVALGDLKVGDQIVAADGATEIVAYEAVAEPLKAYNFEVADHHTYFVGETGAWVHNGKCDYTRPSGFREGVRDEAWESARESSTGQVRDPGTGQFMSPDKPWDMGHKPGHEFRKHQKSAEERGIDRKQFLDEHNKPGHYRPELPASNRGHKGEDLTDTYLGD